MTKPYFSIIIPALNEESYLPHLLSDLKAQSYRDFEVILVDGQSDDKTKKEAQKFTKLLPKLSILTSTRRHVCTQRNLGATKAQGEYLVFMDADNRLPAYFLQGIKYKLESDPAILATTLLSPNTGNTQNTAEITIINTINTATELSKNLDIPLFLESMIIIQKEFFQRIGQFDENSNFSEGTLLINAARKFGHTHTIYHEPRYTYSLRRIHKFGLGKMVTNVARLQLSMLFEQNISKADLQNIYPMHGGGLFKKPQASRSKKFSRAIDQLLKNLSLNNKPLSLKVLKKQLNSLLK